MNILVVSKLAASSIMFFSALFFGFLPIKVRKFLLTSSQISESQAKIALSACLCFGAGVLFATVFLHILPESKTAFISLMVEHKITRTTYPIAELTLCVGFFFIYFIEELAHLWAHENPLPGPESERNSSELESSMTEETYQQEDSESQHSVFVDDGNLPPKGESNHSKENVGEKNNHMVVTGSEIDSKQLSQSHSNNSEEAYLLRSVLVIIALSIHGCFEGLALGLERNMFGVWSFCLAICLHKIVIAFSIGTELLEAGLRIHLCYIQMLVFAAAAPIGALTGLVLYGTLYANTDDGIITIAVLQAISGGTILFVVFCEVLERERAKEAGKFARFIALAIGFSVMAGMQVINEVLEPDVTPNVTDIEDQVTIPFQPTEITGS